MIMNDDNFFCNFIFIDDHWECSKCGQSIEIVDNNPEPPMWPCFNPLQSNDVGSSVNNFMNNYIRQDELLDDNSINIRHSICLKCERFVNNSCEECGCAITKDRNYMNKLASKSESCPLYKW